MKKKFQICFESLCLFINEFDSTIMPMIPVSRELLCHPCIFDIYLKVYRHTCEYTNQIHYCMDSEA